MRAWVLMTALPPTKGHAGLIEFAAKLAPEVHVIVCTQPSEPFASQRYTAVLQHALKVPSARVMVSHLHRELPQDPATPGFWELWKDIYTTPSDYMMFFDYGVEPGDLIVSSEPYGQTLADLTGATFMPYDPKRELFYTKATAVRDDVEDTFDWILPEFQHHLRVNVTVWGAESTGKTTLSKDLARVYGGHWFYEWARPYLETVGPDITIESMEAIWHGQTATQAHSYDFYDKPYAFFDTDLYSTIGYWEQPHWAEDLGPVPKGLIRDAEKFKSDLYVITRSNIEFEADPLRYGGTKRESPDEFWIDIANKYGLNYVVLDSDRKTDRRREAIPYIDAVARAKWQQLEYDRQGF